MENTKDYIFGIRAIQEALYSKEEFDYILIKKGQTGDVFDELRGVAKGLNIPIRYAPIEALNRITRKNHQGIIAYMSAISFSNIDNVMPGIYEKGETPLILILDGITDVRNFGAICRSAECAGVHAIIIPEAHTSRVGGDAVKTSAGALFNIPVCRVTSLRNTIHYLQQSGMSVYGASEKGNKFYHEVDMSVPTAIVMGSEDKGLSTEVIKICDSLVKIPINGKVSSLNVSVAAGVITYEAVRQRMLM